MSLRNRLIWLVPSSRQSTPSRSARSNSGSSTFWSTRTSSGMVNTAVGTPGARSQPSASPLPRAWAVSRSIASATQSRSLKAVFSRFTAPASIFYFTIRCQDAAGSTPSQPGPLFLGLASRVC